jgi:hypothetical protein
VKPKKTKRPAVKRRIKRLEEFVVEQLDRDFERYRRVRGDVSFLGEEVRRHGEILEDHANQINTLDDLQWWDKNPF